MRIMFIIDNDTAEISEIGKKSHARADDKRCIPVPCLNPCVKEFFLREFAGYKDRVVCIQFCVPEMGERKLGNQKKRLLSRIGSFCLLRGLHRGKMNRGFSFYKIRRDECFGKER